MHIESLPKSDVVPEIHAILIFWQNKQMASLYAVFPEFVQTGLDENSSQPIVPIRRMYRQMMQVSSSTVIAA